MSATASTDGDARAWGWVEHLRSGGTTAWSQWQGLAPVQHGVLPGAQQLELLRRINLAGSAPGGLAGRVLTAPAAGRGRADLPLVGTTTSTFGPRPVDPADLPVVELLRVASVLLAEDLVALGPDPVASSWARPWRRSYRVIGDPVVAAATTRHLTARGRPPGGVRPLVVVAAGPLDEVVAHTWTQRCFEHGTQPWPDWVRFWKERDQLPVRADLAAAVRRWAPPQHAVRVVTEHARLPRALGVRGLPAVRVPGADQAELARRVASVVGLMVPRGQRPDLMRTLGARMPATTTPAITLPVSARPWIEAASVRVARDLSRADYPVVGDLADLSPRSASATAAGPSGAGLDRLVLDLAIRMLVDRGWLTTEGTRA